MLLGDNCYGEIKARTLGDRASWGWGKFYNLRSGRVFNSCKKITQLWGQA